MNIFPAWVAHQLDEYISYWKSILCLFSPSPGQGRLESKPFGSRHLQKLVDTFWTANSLLNVTSLPSKACWHLLDSKLFTECNLFATWLFMEFRTVRQKVGLETEYERDDILEDINDSNSRIQYMVGPWPCVKQIYPASACFTALSTNFL